MAKYTLNYEAFREELLNAPWMVEEMRSRAERGKAFAESIAPRDTGEFASSFEVDSGTHGGIHSDRAWATLSSNDPAALSKEFGHEAGGRHVEGSYTLTKTMDVMRG